MEEEIIVQHFLLSFHHCQLFFHQKILIFFGVLSVLSLFLTASITSLLSNVFTLLILFLGFMGAYKRHTGLLFAYWLINVSCIIGGAIAVVVALFVVIPNSIDHDEAYKQVEMQSSNSTHFFNNATASGDSFSSHVPHVEGGVMMLSLIFIVVIVAAAFLFALKIYSLILAWRIRRLLKAAPTTAAGIESVNSSFENSPTPQGPNAVPLVPSSYLPVNTPQGQMYYYYAPQQPQQSS